MIFKVLSPLSFESHSAQPEEQERLIGSESLQL